MGGAQIVSTVMTKVNEKLDKRLTKLEEELEHKITAIMDHISSAVKKLGTC